MLKKSLILFFFFLAFVPLALAANDPYKPYIHKAVVPEHPKVKLYGTYSTNLFPGAGTYTYEIEVPKGTNNLQPALSISYNSQAVKQRPSILGAGWLLTQNYIYRDVNFTPSNTTDDMFRLILNNVNYELVYDVSDGFFHTEIETFARIENLSNASNTYNQSWLLTLKDGTQLRFGYDSDSELTSNVGYDYALKWSLYKITDVHGNNISYSYLEDPNPEDNGTVYPYQILYNNDQKRKIEFSYESTNRPDRRKVYEQGYVLEETRRLSDVYVYFNSSLIRRYNFTYENLNDESSLSSLSKIKYFASDNFSLLHQVAFDYYQSTSSYTNSTTFNISDEFADADGKDLGVRLIDMNNDGYVDIIKGKNGQKSASLNNKTAWISYSTFNPPADFIDATGNEKGLRIADLNNDGFPDLIKGHNNVRQVWLNNGSGWSEDLLTWPLSLDFADASGVDQGARLVDFNGDGRIDILKSKSGSDKEAYLNTGSGWKNASKVWNLTTFFVQSNGKDYGLRLADVNGDGLVDLLQGYNFGSDEKAAWLNNGSGWVNSTVWKPPVVFTTSSKPDQGTRLADLNQDGLIDILEDFANQTTSSRAAWLNNGSGWVYASDYWNSPEPFTLDGKNKGRRIGDINGDGFGDIIIGYTSDKRTVVRNSTIPYLLKNITNEFGGLTNIYYSQSTQFNNTGDDGRSDIGFNVWVVENVLQDNKVSDDFNVSGNTSYYYFGGKYDYNDSEFRGFNIVNETLDDSSTIAHYFHQDDILKGKEYSTITYDLNNNIFSKSENNFNITTTDSGIFISHLDSSSSYLYDGSSLNPIIINISYKYDNYSNVIEKISYGNINISGDEKYENYSYAYNISEWILDKVNQYILSDSSFNKLKQTKYFYDGNELGFVSIGDLTKTEEWLEGSNPITRFSYDDYGNLIYQIGPLGRVTRYEYGLTDSTYTYPNRIINALDHKTDYEYDVGTGNLLTKTKDGITKTFEYDAFGRIEREIMPYGSYTSPTKSYTYSFDGSAPESIKISQKTNSNNTIDTYYFYDGFGNLVQIKTPAENNQIIKNIFYDGLFRVKEEQNPYFDSFSTSLVTPSSTINRTYYQYDALSRITKVTNPDGTIKNTTYNKNIINDYDENNNYKTYYLDAYDRITAVEEHNIDFYFNDNETYNTTYTYNGKDELVGIRDHYGNEFNFSYDSLGRKIQLDDPDLGTWKYSYDSAGNLIKQTDNIGNGILMSYDSLNRIHQKNASSVNYTFNYDEQYQGTLSSINFSNFTFSYEYDERLRVLKETIMEGGTDSYETGLTYDSMDRIIEKILPSNEELEFYYNEQGKLNKIRGYINQTNYNAFGNPLNRSYFNAKITTFDYYSDNARLKQIKTDTVQNLNYSYDDVGNVVSINDSANNRYYAMSYDNLDRLTNVSINAYKWVYSYDPLGNILKIVRNFSTTTSFKFDSGLAHAPSKVIDIDTGVDVYRDKNYNNSNKTKIFELYLVNEKNNSLTYVNWTAEFGDGTVINSTKEFNLSKDENVLVLIEHNYTKGSDYRINFTSKTNSTVNDYETLKLIFGAVAQRLDIIKQNATLIISEFYVENTINELSQNWGWNCSNGIQSTVPFNMSGSKGLFVIMEHNYSLDVNSLDCEVNSSDGNQSFSIPLTYDGIEISEYNSSKLDTDSIQIKFKIKNYFTMQDVNWNITVGNEFYESAAPITLTQGEETTISQQIDFTNGGLKKIYVQIGGEHNFTYNYTEYYFINWLNIDGFINVIKNGTARVFDFLVSNKNTLNTTALWNISDPGLENTTSLNDSELLIVVIEEDYSQGKKEPTIKIFNQTAYETKLIDIFTIKQIGIDEFNTLYENSSWAISSALITNNIEPLNLSWQLNNSQELITSINNTELATNQQALIVVESNFSEDGVYPLKFKINSSNLNDNESGVAVS